MRRDHALDGQVGGYSTGMKTRLALVRLDLTRRRVDAARRALDGIDVELDAIDQDQLFEVIVAGDYDLGSNKLLNATEPGSGEWTCTTS